MRSPTSALHGLPDSVDYPDYGYKLAEHLAAGLSERGVALGGSGIGIADRRQPQPSGALRAGVRAALFFLLPSSSSSSSPARLARTRNDANASRSARG